MLSAGSAFLVVNHPAQIASASGASNAQAQAIVFDTARIVELLKRLLSLRAPIAVQAPGISAPTNASSSPVSTTKPASTNATPVTKKQSASAAARTVPATPATPPQSPTEKALGLVLPNVRSALVNIVCLPTTDSSTLKGISGSGIIIDPQGVILTAAHVAQYELLAEARPDLVGCFVRTGSPATFAYKARPVYVSSAWVAQNAQTLSSTEPRGTGENDFGLLAITASDTSSPLPSAFPSVSLSNTPATMGEPVVIGTYGAEFLTSARIRSDLFPTLVFGAVHDLFTFHTDTLDLVSLGGGAAAQQGSSGGGIINQGGQLVALITTSSSGTDLASRDLHAITTTYLQRAFTQESGLTLSGYLTGASPTSLANTYQDQAVRLANTLIQANGLK